MQKNIRRYWPIFLLPTLAAFLHRLCDPVYSGSVSVPVQVHHHQQNHVRGSEQLCQGVSGRAIRTRLLALPLSFTVVSTVLINVIALGIALLLTRGIKGTNLFRTVFFMPNLIGGIVLGYIWHDLLNGILSPDGQAAADSERHLRLSGV